jgi:hypothetical protein
MATQNQFENDARVSTTLKNVADESTRIKRELTDDEIAAVAGGHAVTNTITNTIPLPGPGTGGGTSTSPAGPLT